MRQNAAYREASHEPVDATIETCDISHMQGLETPNFHFTPAPFGSLDVERMTGLTQLQQRDWRRRGILRHGGAGVRTYSAMDVAEIAVRRALNKVGVPLTEDVPELVKAGEIVFVAMCREHLYQEHIGYAPDAFDELQEKFDYSSKLLFVQCDDHSIDETHSRVEFVESSVFGSSEPSEDSLPSSLGAVWAILDLNRMGNELFARANRPVVTVTPRSRGAR